MVGEITTESHVESFNEHRPILFGIAWRMLGNSTEAEDLLQEAFLRWTRTNPREVRSPRAFLVTVVTRLCLNHLDLARVKKEISFDLDATRDWLASTEASLANDTDLADALDAAFSVVLKCFRRSSGRCFFCGRFLSVIIRKSRASPRSPRRIVAKFSAGLANASPGVIRALR
ncbi:MAG TPA: sigma factor [Verrucomicrobiae bacterium]|jgi:hypothetical protein|nr:sigma factor [Verrucomicrobiae bacterium]